MQQLKQSESIAARRRVPVCLVDDTDGKTPETGVTLSAGDMKISKNGGAEANHAGSLVELAGGDYYYEFTQGELDTLGYLTGRIVISGVRTFRIAAQVVAFDPNSASNLGLSNLDAAITTRPAASDYTASRAAKLDNLDATITSRPAATDYTTARATKLDNLDATVASRADKADYTTARAARLDNLDATISSRSTLTTAQVNAEFVDGLASDTYSEPATVPPATSSLKDKIGWLFAWARNKVTQSATTQAVRNDADSGTIGTSAVSDDGTTFTRGKYS